MLWHTDILDSVTGNYAVAMGYRNKSLGSSSTTTGLFNVASGTGSFATGYLNNVEGDYAVALGRSGESISDYSVTAGFF